MSDIDLVRRCQAGERAAWTQLYGAHKDYIYKLAYLVTQNSQDAHDVTQETFIRLVDVINRYDAEKAAFETWLYTIVVNLARDHLRKRKRLPLPWELIPKGGEMVAEDGQPERSSLNREWQQEIWEAVNSLSDKQRIVVILRYYADLSCQEIAEILSCPEGTVHSRLYYARLALENLLTEREAVLATGVA
jgi:RNA polymerase sigma-70 factor (ECF subfamily)